MNTADLDSYQLLMLFFFLVGFCLIAFSKKIDSVLTAFITAISCWILVAIRQLMKNHNFESDKFYHGLGETSNIVFFLIFALILVEIVKLYHGFDGLNRRWRVFATKNKTMSFEHLLWAVTLTAFFLASVIDNVTAALIVTVTLKKIVKNREDLFFLAFFGGVIGANAGGTFSPIGEITTTQLWAGGQITFLQTVLQLFIPSLISIIVPLTLFSILNKNKTVDFLEEGTEKTNINPTHTTLILLTTILSMLIVVPFLKGVMNLPPSIGALTALCIVWIIISLIEDANNKLSPEKRYKTFNIKDTFAEIEWETPLFFLGILLAVEALKYDNILQTLGASINMLLNDIAFKQPLITFIVGIISSVMDNVALVATVQGMYPKTLDNFGQNSPFWFLLSFCAGTGGSIFIVGSAAGVAVRNKLQSYLTDDSIHLDEWYRHKITLWAFINYVTGFLVYLIQQSISH